MFGNLENHIGVGWEITHHMTSCHKATARRKAISIITRWLNILCKVFCKYNVNPA